MITGNKEKCEKGEIYNGIFRNQEANDLINKGFVIHRPQKILRKADEGEPESKVQIEDTCAEDRSINEAKEEVKIYREVKSDPQSNRACLKPKALGNSFSSKIKENVSSLICRIY